jgi:hypothetical protein
MRRTILVLVALSFLRCASFSADSDGFVRYESINRDTVLLRFTSSPAGAKALISCDDGFDDQVTTPDTVRLPIEGLCTVTFVKSGYREEVAEFDPAAYAHGSVFAEPDCGDPGVWCDAPESFGRVIFGSIFLGMSGLIARAADPIRRGRGEIGAVLEPLHEDNGSDSAQPRG